MGKIKGLEIAHDPPDHPSELPSLVTVDGKQERLDEVPLTAVLESEHYMRYALGATTTFSILARLDRIVVICKTYTPHGSCANLRLVGETYHIGGIHLDAQAA